MTEFVPYLVISQEDFKKNMAIDVSPYVKQLSGNDYLAWGVSLTLLREYNPELAVGFENNEEGHPIFHTSNGSYLLAFVYNKLTGQRTPSIFFPVRNNKRQASVDPDAANVGNQQQRAIAKVIAQEVGIGWSLYSRIDESMLELEESDKAVTSISKPSAGAKALIKSTNKTQHDDMDF